ncbi:MAG: efflux RND transporter periplasmic adaptor subunit [Victivallaceae bacterium]|nr:efflux RND transporter periplasmic adaptor subunit [Victivallaceae bacterium]
MRKIIFLVIGIAVLGALAYGITVKIQNAAQRNKPKRSQAKAGSGIAIPVEIADVEVQPMRNTRTFTGTLEPWSKYEVAPKIAGRLETLNVEVGDPVYNGQLLATIDDDEYLQEIEKAKADLGISEALKGELLTQFNLAKLEYERAKNMKKGNVISDSAYESKRSDLLVKAASLKKAQAELNQKLAILNLAKVRFDYTKIYARWGKTVLLFKVNSPGQTRAAVQNTLKELFQQNNFERNYDIKTANLVEQSAGDFLLVLELTNPVFDYAVLLKNIESGLEKIRKKLPAGTTLKYQDFSETRYIGKKYLDAGQMLKANDAILSIINIRRMKAMVNVIEKDYPLIKSGQEAAVSTDAYPEKVFSGRVRKITKVLDEYTRQGEVEIEIDNSRLMLRPGMFVKVSIEFDTIANAQIVPRTAVVNFNETIGVFMLSADRKTVKFVPVKTGLIDADRVQIVSPRLIRPVVTLGSHLLYNGIAIKVTSRETVLKNSLENKPSGNKPRKSAEAKQK